MVKILNDDCSAPKGAGSSGQEHRFGRARPGGRRLKGEWAGFRDGMDLSEAASNIGADRRNNRRHCARRRARRHFTGMCRFFGRAAGMCGMLHGSLPGIECCKTKRLNRKRQKQRKTQQQAHAGPRAAVTFPPAFPPNRHSTPNLMANLLHFNQRLAAPPSSDCLPHPCQNRLCGRQGGKPEFPDDPR
ncbi:MAG: hypothetical protein WAT78_13730 [Rhizobiaceae bacterium]